MKYILVPTEIFDDGTDRDPESMLMSLLNEEVKLCEKYIQSHPGTPPVLESEVRYAFTYSARDIGLALRSGIADADTLVCWRVAELRMQGEQAEPVLVKIPRVGGGITYTCRVRRGDGTIEDVVEIVRKKGS